MTESFTTKIYTYFVFTIGFLMLGLAIAVHADNQNSRSETSDKVLADTCSLPFAFLVKHPADDFKATGGVAYFIREAGVTCTLPPASSCAGKEILIDPPSMAKHSVFGNPKNTYIIQTTNGEHIFWNAFVVDRKILGKNTAVQVTLISDGENWHIAGIIPSETWTYQGN
jgi:hypothetical protein